LTGLRRTSSRKRIPVGVDGAVDRAVAQLECVECDAAVARFKRAGRAYLTCEPDDEDEYGEPVEVVVLCPDCSDREFGERWG
jgi:hypothetical protein